MTDFTTKNFDFSTLSLKPDHYNRPLWVCTDGHIFLETSSPFFECAYAFCIAISEPVSRPETIHEYQISPYSLYAAVSIGIETEEIIHTLSKLSKNIVEESLIDKIREETLKYGKVKFVLRNNKFFLETELKNFLDRIIDKTSLKLYLNENNTIDGDCKKRYYHTFNQSTEGSKQVYSVEIKSEGIEYAKKVCRDAGYPSFEEYVFQKDFKTPNLAVNLKRIAKLRPYQKSSLSAFLGGGSSRSGIIVLPCGAGKTLLGISAACFIGKSTIVFATTGVSCSQWEDQFLKWTDIAKSSIKMLTATRKDSIEMDKACVLITTYSMIAYNQKRSKESELRMSEIKEREWGLAILDEVHVAPADMFRRCLSVTKSKCKLGLTATLVREDKKIEDLYFLIGPKLYEADWLSLQKDRYLATVQCVEVWCPMSPEFLEMYLKDPSINKKTLLQTMNPSKIRNCQYLIEKHEKKGDKIMVFSDNIYSLKKYAVLFKKPFIYGKTSDTERILTLRELQKNPNLNTIFISKVGDCSIDLPDVNVVIQISSHFSSRRQEAQRLGRILRPKAKSDALSHFYSLVSTDTDEYFYSARRQRFLVDQGYSFKSKESFVDDVDEKRFCFSSKKERLNLLREVMRASDKSGCIEKDMEEISGRGNVNKRSDANKPKRRKMKSNKIMNIKMGLLRNRVLNKEF